MSDTPRVMIAEDEFLVALVLEEDLRASGYTVLGPYSTVEDASYAASTEAMHAAVLDINMAGKMAFPVADALRDRGIPYLFLSGYTASTLPEAHRGVPCLAKPYELSRLLRELRRLVADAEGSIHISSQSDTGPA
ncbi:MAG TPA: response regulator [Candidatus Binatia bacterium]|nr:response regulator [Candidatus Binatia bacterium]